jgi:hypothetical protein
MRRVGSVAVVAVLMTVLTMVVGGAGSALAAAPFLEGALPLHEQEACHEGQANEHSDRIFTVSSEEFGPLPEGCYLAVPTQAGGGGGTFE